MRRVGLAVLLGMLPVGAAADIVCTVTASIISGNYDPLQIGDTDDAGTVTLQCTRSLSDPNRVRYRLKATDGLHASGSLRRQRNAVNAGVFLDYGLFRDAARSQRWGTSNGQSITERLDFGGATSAEVSWPFYSRLPAGQTGAILGHYTDTVIAEAYVPHNAATPMSSAPFGMTTTLIGSCGLTSAPGTVVFDYTSFSAVPSAASTSFSLTCVAAVPYTLALDATGGTLNGLSYTLGLSAPSGTGNGSAQTFTIDGAIAAGQGGVCAGATCSASETRYLTITY
ncbi:spore coat protein U domain-containing protein [Piscinibacter sp.]|uniref:spore coat protein U domain-containing protein n=1 Tax=Piscinibacter sp. TaxID=1903157 RepID=UPI002C5891F4|nr:spore coat protein U domain-containing protein [Albitalea sp.]HUG24710.1 spore coat protein U domain-containing protein [Albitalea sp.]